MLSRVCIFCFFLFSCSILSAQVTHMDMVQDTVIYRSTFLNRTYLLNGKTLTLPVMAFFMKDFPTANNAIRVAQLSDQMCVVSYSLGSLVSIGGLMVSRQNKELGQDLIQLGLAGVGAGLIFQIISGSFKFRAVQYYNEEIKRIYPQKNAASFHIKADFNQVGVLVGFN